MIPRNDSIERILPVFRLEGAFRSAEEMHSGNVHATYHLTFDVPHGTREYILQQINTFAFRDPRRMMDNIVRVTDHLRSEMTRLGMDPRRRVLEIIPTAGGELVYTDPNGGCWRIYTFIQDASAYDTVDAAAFYQVGRGFGTFQKLLSSFPADELYESIPDFHNTCKRFDMLLKAAEEDSVKRAARAQDEIGFFIERREMLFSIVRMLEEKALPLRVTHNDTKSNNVMLDNTTGEALCVIDLDTVMPGSVLYDYGDAIRFGANRAPEDEPDMGRIGLDMEKARSFTRGFIEETAGYLTKEEVHLLPLGIKVMTGELAMRFLTDYLMGDPYFKIAYPDHNLVRARAQTALLRDIEKQEDALQQMVDSMLG